MSDEKPDITVITIAVQCVSFTYNALMHADKQGRPLRYKDLMPSLRTLWPIGPHDIEILVASCDRISQCPWRSRIRQSRAIRGSGISRLVHIATIGQPGPCERPIILPFLAVRFRDYSVPCGGKIGSFSYQSQDNSMRQKIKRMGGLFMQLEF
eukprot:1326152-Amorphochlora_amoeboformis.AAC.1